MSKNLELLKSLSAKERKELMQQLQQEEKDERLLRREAYESLREDVLTEVQSRIVPVAAAVLEFREWIEKETGSFRSVMNEYGQIRSDSQGSFLLSGEKFRVEVKSNKVKGFDERADMAASRLMEYLKNWVANSDRGIEDPMYQLCMLLLERNRQGDLDYKSISKLYDLEAKFDDEYKSIMDLFRESNVVNTTVVNYYFYEKKDGVWHKIEPSFCRL